MKTTLVFQTDDGEVHRDEFDSEPGWPTEVERDGTEFRMTEMIYVYKAGG